jgi:rod shape-determining protein MreD
LRLILLFGLFGMLGLAFETAVPHLISARSLIPNLIVILAVDLGLRHHGVLPAIIAFGMGYATDALAGSHPGLNAFMVTLVFLVSYEFSSRLLVTNAFVGATIVFFGVIAADLGAIAIGSGLGALGESGPMVPSILLRAMISALVAPLVFSILAGSKRLVGLPARAARE